MTKQQTHNGDYSRKNCITYNIVGYLDKQANFYKKYSFTYKEIAEEFKCSIRTVCNAIQIIKTHTRFQHLRVEYYYNSLGERSGSTIFLTATCNNRVIKNNKESSLKTFETEKFKILLQRTDLKQDIQTNKEETWNFYQISKRMFYVLCGDFANLEAEFHRHYHHNPTATLQLLFSFYRTRKFNISKKVLSTLRKMWNATDEWFQDHILKGLQEWYERIDNSAKQLSLFTSKIMVKSVAKIKSQVQEIHKSYKQTNELRKEIKKTFKLRYFRLRFLDISKTERVLKFFQNQERTSGKDFSLFLYALKYVKVGIDDRLYDTNKKSEFLLSGIHHFEPQKPLNKLRENINELEREQSRNEILGISNNSTKKINITLENLGIRI